MSPLNRSTATSKLSAMTSVPFKVKRILKYYQHLYK